MGRGTLPGVLGYLRRLSGQRDAGPSSDRQLLERFAARRDEAAFTALLARHGPMVWGVCSRVLGNAEDAEDAFQATFLVLARKAGAAGWRDSVAGWLHAVARRVAWKARSAAVVPPVSQREEAAMSDADPLAQAARQELRVVGSVAVRVGDSLEVTQDRAKFSLSHGKRALERTGLSG